MTLMVPGHRLDPIQAIPYRRLTGLLRMVQRRPELHAQILRVRRAQTVHDLKRTKNRRGPVGLALEALAQLGWSWPAGSLLVSRKGVDTDLATIDHKQWEHEVRAAAREQRWKDASARRTDMVGVERGVDREATAYAWLTEPVVFTAGVLRSVVAGAVWTHDRRHRAFPKEYPSPACPHCAHGDVVADVEHLWWDCAAWDSVRAQHPDAIIARRTDWPPCLLLCGIVLLDTYPTLEERRQTASAVQHMYAAIVSADRAGKRPASDNRVHEDWAVPMGLVSPRTPRELRHGPARSGAPPGLEVRVSALPGPGGLPGASGVTAGH